MVNQFKALESIIHSLHLKYQIPKPQIEAVIKAQFDFVQKVINRGDCESVRLTHLGIFRVTPGRKILSLDLKQRESKITRDNFGVEELRVSESDSGEGSPSES